MRIMFLVFALMLSVQSQAQSFRAGIKYLMCRSLNTTVMFTGNWGPDAYFNVTQVNAFGFPFTQQARVLDVSTRSERNLQFHLQTMLTNAELYLTIVTGSSDGYLQFNDGTPLVTMQCSSEIVR